GVGRAGPGVSLEVRYPVVGHLVAVLAPARTEPEAFAFGGSRRRREGGLEPGVLVGNVVRDDVDDRPDAEGQRFPDERLRLLEVAERGVDAEVVLDVVAAVGEG